MTDSVCTGLVVVVGEVAAGCVDLVGVPEQPVVPDAGGEGEQALAMRVQTPSGMWPPWSSRESWPLSESLIDSIHWRTLPSLPNRLGSSLRSGRMS